MQEGHRLSVLQVTPELNAGGVERTTIEMAEAISRAGGLALVASAGGRLEGDLEAAGGEIIRLPVNTKNPATAFANALRLAQVVRARGVNIIHARSRAPAWSALLAARMTRTPFVTTFHGIYNARSPLKRFYNSVMARGDLVIANSAYTREHILANFAIKPERVVAIPRGVDLDVFDRTKVTAATIAAMRKAWKINPADQRLVILAPARLTRWKGQLVLVEAAKLLEQKRPGSFKIVFAGDAQGRHAYVEEIQRALIRAKLQDAVHLAGHVRDMPAALAAADVAVFPVTDPEAFGRGAVEAQAMGLPVIASQLGGYGETVVDNETGLLVPSDAPVALFEALDRVIAMGESGRVEMGQRGAIRARALYSKAALQSATLAVYQRLLG